MQDLQSLAHAALLIPQLGPRSLPFAIIPPATPTFSSALVHPWELGPWTNTKMEPFDEADLLGKELSDLRWCGRKVTGAQGAERGIEVVPCSDCPIGYKVASGDRGPLMCRDPPTCGADGSCTDCRFSPLTPWLSVPCESCISYGCNSETGACVCNKF